LAGFKVPRHVVVVEELPVTASGKVVKAEIRERLAQNPELLGKRL
jgi:fatty-acyl-CoA synthase